MKLDDIRRDYVSTGLSFDDLNQDPILQFQAWIQQAVDAEIKDPTAMTLATVDESGMPNQRIVLLKGLDERGFVFFSNYSSAKAKEMDANPSVSIHFPWHVFERQVKIRGLAKRVSKAESLSYFLSRPRESQLAAWASKQSARINSRQFLMSQFSAMKEKFANGDVPVPDFWGGYRIEPTSFEFWQGRENRLHDRFVYSRDGNNWRINRLAP